MSWYGSLWVHLVLNLLSLFAFWYQFSSLDLEVFIQLSSNALSIVVLSVIMASVSVVMFENHLMISYVAFVLSLSFCLLSSHLVI